MSANGDGRQRFGDYELDSHSGRLFRDGQPVKIQPQPLRVLGLLVEHPGEIVSREQLRTCIWGDATFVEFDQGLNYCIRQIRLVLHDEVSEPVYIETLPKQGYRFIAPIAANGHTSHSAPPAVEDESPDDPKQRLQAIGDWRLLLEEPTAALAAAPSHSRLGRLTGIAAAVLAVVAASSSWIAWRATRPVDQPLKPLVRLDIDLGSDVSLDSLLGSAAIISPDGTRLVYMSRSRLFTRRLDQPKATELAGTEAPRAPFFSPDGQWVAFFAQGKLKKISVDGGAAIALCDASSSGGGSWGEDGNIIAGLANGALSRIPSAGGAPTPVTELAQGEFTHRWPQILPGGKAVLFTSSATGNAWDGANIEVVSLADRRRKRLQRGGTYGRYVPSSNGRDGHLIYVNRGTLFAVPFDLETLAVRGTPSPVLEQVSYSSANGFAQFDFSQKGTLVYRSGNAEGSLLTVQWLDSAGKMQPLLAKPDAYQSARLSPDGQRLALSTTDIWVYEWQRDTMTRLTFGESLGGNSTPAVWSPDGRYVIFRKPGEGLFWTRSDGAGQPQLLAQNRRNVMAYSFTPDGKRLAFREFAPGTGSDLWTMPVESDGAGLRGGKPEMFLGTQFSERDPAFSPDGRWLAYTSHEGGTNQIFVRAFPDRGGKWQISSSSGAYPEWSRNGRELFFRTDDNQIAVAAYTVRGDSFVADKPRMWSEKPLAQTLANGSNYNLAPDGKRIVVFMPVDASEAQKAQNHLIFLQNFFDELRRKVPASK
jgi:Tol biopolymer transport system component/DNA-binding winged helix-turn-helix (wHTH) protein